MQPVKHILIDYIELLSNAPRHDSVCDRYGYGVDNAAGLMEFSLYLAALSVDDPRFTQLRGRVTERLTSAHMSMIAWQISRFRLYSVGESEEQLLNRLVALPPD